MKEKAKAANKVDAYFSFLFGIFFFFFSCCLFLPLAAKYIRGHLQHQVRNINVGRFLAGRARSSLHFSKTTSDLLFSCESKVVVLASCAIGVLPCKAKSNKTIATDSMIIVSQPWRARARFGSKCWNYERYLPKIHAMWGVLLIIKIRDTEVVAVAAAVVFRCS